MKETDEGYTRKEQQVINNAKELLAPFKDEQLEWISSDGKQTGTVSLHKCVKKLQKTLDAEQEELIRQWDEWVTVEAELDQIATEVAMTASGLPAIDAELEAEVEAEKKRFRQLMDEATKAAEKAMKQAEKVTSLISIYSLTL